MPPARRRARRKQVVGVAATTAVVAGTAGAVHHHQNKKYAKKDAADQAQYEDQYVEEAPPQQVVYAAPPPPAAPAPSPEADMMAQLTQLSQMHDAGILSDDEFAGWQGEAARHLSYLRSSKTETGTSFGIADKEKPVPSGRASGGQNLTIFK